MMSVRVILVDTTMPLRMRPRIETLPVKGHFLSTYVPTCGFCSVSLGGVLGLVSKCVGLILTGITEGEGH